MLHPGHNSPCQWYATPECPYLRAMDFAGWFEAHLGGCWYTFDARTDRTDVDGLARNAIDVAIAATFGRVADVGVALDVITSGVAAGELSAEEVAHLRAVVEDRRKLVELLDLEARIAALEATAGRTR